MSNRHLYKRNKHAGKDKKKMKANGRKLMKELFPKEKKQKEWPQWFIDDINDMYDKWEWRRE